MLTTKNWPGYSTREGNDQNPIDMAVNIKKIDCQTLELFDANKKLDGLRPKT